MTKLLENCATPFQASQLQLDKPLPILIQQFNQVLEEFKIELNGELDINERKAEFIQKLASIDLQQALIICLNSMLQQLPLAEDVKTFTPYLLLFDKLLEAKLIVDSSKKPKNFGADERTLVLEQLFSSCSVEQLKKLISLQDCMAEELNQGWPRYITTGLVSMATYYVYQPFDIQLDLKRMLAISNPSLTQECLQASLTNLQQDFSTAAVDTTLNLAYEQKQAKSMGPLAKYFISTENQSAAKLYAKREKVLNQSGKILAITSSLKKQGGLSIEALKNAYATELKISDPALQDFHIYTLLQMERVGDKLTGLGLFQQLQGTFDGFMLSVSADCMDNGHPMLIGDPDIEAETVHDNPGAVFYRIITPITCNHEKVGELCYDYTIDKDKKLQLAAPKFTFTGLSTQEQQKFLSCLEKEMPGVYLVESHMQDAQNANKRLSMLNFGEFEKLSQLLEQNSAQDSYKKASSDKPRIHSVSKRLSKLDTDKLNELYSKALSRPLPLSDSVVASSSQPEMQGVAKLAPVKKAAQPTMAKPVDTLTSTLATVGASLGGVVGGVVGVVVATVTLPLTGPLALLVFTGITFVGAGIGGGLGAGIGHIATRLLTVQEEKPVVTATANTSQVASPNLVDNSVNEPINAELLQKMKANLVKAKRLSDRVPDLSKRPALYEVIQSEPPAETKGLNQVQPLSYGTVNVR